MKKIDPKKIRWETLLNRGIKFHGHLGPYLILGLKAGILALKKLNSTGYKNLEVLAYTGCNPPRSCIVDGVQISTGCTLGKGNIEIYDRSHPQIKFSCNSKVLTVEIREKILEDINQGEPLNTAREISDLPPEQLFTWKIQ